MPAFLPGIELSRRFYAEAVRPLLGDRPHAAARIGPGSDVLGFDSARSTDHDWGPRVELFVDDPGDLSALLRQRLPTEFHGWPVHFRRMPDGVRVMASVTAPPVDHLVTVTTLAGWGVQRLGFDPRGTPALLDWLATPWQRFAEFGGGAVFHDDGGDLSAARERLRWYPADVWRHVLACQWTRIAQEEAFAGRAGEDGDELGALVVTARLAREVGRLLLVMGRCWPPYQKWLMRALTADPAAALLRAALTAPEQRDREDALCAAFEMAADRQNALGLCAELPAGRRTFHQRGYPVIGADRFAAALRDAVTDERIHGLPLTGCADQISDNTDLLGDPRLTRAAIRPTIETV